MEGIELYLFIGGYVAEHLGNSIMIYKLKKQQSMYGISIDTQLCLMATTLARLLWMTDTMLNDLPIAYVEICFALFMHGCILYFCYKYKDSIYRGIKQFYIKSWFLIAVCGVLSVMVHPGPKGEYFFTLQMLVSFTMYLEALALIP